MLNHKRIKTPPGLIRKPFYGWVIVGVAFLIGFTEAGVFQNVLSIFMKPMALEFDWSRAMITGAIAFGSVTGGLVSPFIGPFLDRHGPRKVAFVGILALSFGLMMLTRLSRIWQLYVFFGLGRMIAVGILGLVIVVSVSNWFYRKRGRAMGIAQLGSRIGTAVLPPAVQIMIWRLGWRLAWFGLGLVVIILAAVPSLLFLKRRPEDIGLLPDGDPTDELPNDRTSPEVIQKSDLKTATDKTIWSRKQVFRTRTFWQLSVSFSLILFCGAGTNFHLFPFFTDQGLSSGIAVTLISTISICGALGGIMNGFLAEKYSPKRLLAFNVVLMGFLFLSIFRMVDSTSLIFLFAVIWGVIRGGVLPLMPLIWVEFYGSRSAGTVMGQGGPFRMTANAIGPIFAAFFFDLLHSYVVPFSVFAVLLVLSGFIALGAKPPKQ